MAKTGRLNNDTIMLKLQKGPQQATGHYFTMTVIEGADFGYVFQLEKDETVIGRKDPSAQNEACADIQLEDGTASRRHLLVVKRELPKHSEDADAIVYAAILDLGSKNGTYVNDTLISDTEIKLVNGDKIKMGDTVLKYEVKDRLDYSYQERMYQQVTRDALTGLWNHNYLRQELEKLLSLGVRHNWPFSILLFEIDIIQTLNETYGREVGDALLRSVGQILMTGLNDYNTVGRYQSKQFLVLLPETELKGALTITERLKQSVEETDFSPMGCPQRVTVSTGIAQFPLAGNNTQELLKQADDALYRAKQAGGNSIATADVTEAAATKTTRNYKKFLPLLIILAALLAISQIYNLVTSYQQRQLLFYGMIEAYQSQVGSKLSGRVKEVLVNDGDTVQAGQVLARFDVADLLAQRSQLEARVEQAKLALDKLNDETGNAATKTSAETEPVKPKPEILYARAHLQELTGQLDQLNLQVAEGEVRAPSVSRVEAINVRPGELLPANKPIAKLLAYDQTWVSIYVSEPKLGNVRIKQPATITIDTFPNQKFTGYVEQIASEAEFFPRNVQTREEREYQVFRVKIHIDDTSNKLKPGMSAEVKLEPTK